MYQLLIAKDAPKEGSKARRLSTVVFISYAAPIPYISHSSLGASAQECHGGLFAITSVTWVTPHEVTFDNKC